MSATPMVFDLDEVNFADAMIWGNEEFLRWADHMDMGLATVIH
jgi:hypothetical protein